MRHLALATSAFALFAAPACTIDEDPEELHERSVPTLQGDLDCHCTDCEGCWRLAPDDLAIDIVVLDASLLDGAPETMTAVLPVEDDRTIDLPVYGEPKGWTPISTNGLTLRVLLDDGVLQPPPFSLMPTTPIAVMDEESLAIVMDQVEAAEVLDLGGLAPLPHER